MSEKTKLPDWDTLRELGRKAHFAEPFTAEEYRALTTVLMFVQNESMYWFKQGSRKEPRV